MNAMRILLVTGLALAWTAPTAPAGSIYARAGGRDKSLVSDDTARQVGDIVTILIEEDSQISNDAQRKLEKKTDRSGKMDGSLTLGDLFGTWRDKTIQFPELDASSSSDATIDGKTDYSQGRKVSDQISVTVEDVLPNGNMVVLGKRKRKVEGDLQTVQVSGIVRPSDIDFSNTINSNRVANFNVVYSSQGEETYYENPGWLERILARINPF